MKILFQGDSITDAFRKPGEINQAFQPGNGYAFLVAVIYQTILDHQLPTSKIVCFGDSITFGSGIPGEGTATGWTYPARLASLLNHPVNLSQQPSLPANSI